MTERERRRREELLPRFYVTGEHGHTNTKYPYSLRDGLSYFEKPFKIKDRRCSTASRRDVLGNDFGWFAYIGWDLSGRSRPMRVDGPCRLHSLQLCVGVCSFSFYLRYYLFSYELFFYKGKNRPSTKRPKPADQASVTAGPWRGSFIPSFFVSILHRNLFVRYRPNQKSPSQSTDIDLV